ncbi:urease subunit gamma [uncultured Corynebacterium sp.]|uniref:urease subunit gamma n=1 Tax=uncultured Corynebacterium sp. TaxID=159447 RepID=UPI0025EAEA1E|nr:urease subunit gamma [uncultured Corynebacterium sp.]
MELTPREIDKLMVFTAAQVARRRWERGVTLNKPEAVAMITDAVVEAARDGVSVARAAEIGTLVLSEDDVMTGIRASLPLIQVEATFPDGTKLVSVHDPIGGPADPAAADPTKSAADKSPETAE